MAAVVTGIGAYVPSRRMSNNEIAQMVDTSDEWIFSHTGIRHRHLAAPTEAASDLAFEASRAALKKANLEGRDLDMIVLATTSPDYPGFPATACILQDRLGAVNAGALDLTAACSGFVYSLETARAFIHAGTARNVLVVGSEILSRIMNWKDRNTCVLFGDGAGAAVVQSSDEVGRGIVNSVLSAIGKDADSLIRPVGGSRRPFDPATCFVEDTYIKMDGKKVYMFAVDALRRTIEILMEKNDLTISDLDWIVPHQANLRIIEACAKRLGMPMDKFFVNIDEYANTSAASIPIALVDMDRKGLLKPGQKIITVGFGGGLTYGGNYLVW